MTLASRYRQRSAEVITQALRGPRPESLKAARKLLKDAYPFRGAREGWCYQCWLVEVRAALVALAKLHGWELPKLARPRSRRRRNVPGQLMLWGGGLARAA